MPITLAAPLQPPAQPTFAIFNIAILLEPVTAVSITYGAVDGGGSLIGALSTVKLGAAGLAAFRQRREVPRQSFTPRFKQRSPPCQAR